MQKLQAGVVLPSDDSVDCGRSISGGGYEPRDRHKQKVKVIVFMMLVRCPLFYVSYLICQ